MLLKYFYDAALAHASYLVGCQKTSEALVIDPGRDIQAYLDAAAEHGMTITGAADTHIHADYVSGTRELAVATDATLYLSDEGNDEWFYAFASEHTHHLLRDGERFSVGKVELEVMHTPGHTPESLSFLLTDRGGGADSPMGIFTGDFVFVGSIGRPDLLEKAAGIQGTARAGAQDLFKSIQRFLELPDHVQVWPAHGAGSACGKGLGSIPSSTVGYEKRYNPALQFKDAKAFTDYILAEQPEPPSYFAIMKQVNKEGPVVLGPPSLPDPVKVKELPELALDLQVLDTRPPAEFAKAHLPGTINIPFQYIAAWAGWLIDYNEPLYLISSPEELPEVVRVLNKIGIDDLEGWADPAAVLKAGLAIGTYEQGTPESVAELLEDGHAILIDVRGDTEWAEQHIPEARRCFLGGLSDHLREFEGECPLIFQCRSGGRSAIASSVAKAIGVHRVINLQGGIQAWAKAGLPVVAGTADRQGPGEDASTVEAANQGQAVFWNASCPAEDTNAP